MLLSGRVMLKDLPFRGIIDSANSIIAVLLGISDNIKNLLLSFTQIVIVLLLLALVALFIAWLSGIVGKRMEILPFLNATQGNRFEDKALADLLIKELHRISRIHSLKLPGIHSEKLRISAISPATESMTSSISNLGTIGIGGCSLPIGQLVITLQHLWPIGKAGNVITGSLQKDGSTFRLVAHCNGSYEGSWEVTYSEYHIEAIKILFQDLAFMIARDLATDCSAKTWEGLKNFTEGLSSYNKYIITGNKKELDSARDNCLKALSAEKGYTILCFLLYNIGVGFWDNLDWKNTKDMFLKAIELKPDLEEHSITSEHFKPYAEMIVPETIIRDIQLKSINRYYARMYNGLGVSYRKEDNYIEAINAYEKSIELDKDYESPIVNIGILYTYLGNENLKNEREHLEKAREYLEKAKKMNINSIPIKIGLAYVYKKLNYRDKFDKICSEISQKLLEEEKEYDQACYLAILGKTKESILLLRKAIDLKQCDIEMILNLKFLA